MASYREIRALAQSGIQGRGAGYHAAKAIDAENRARCLAAPRSGDLYAFPTRDQFTDAEIAAAQYRAASYRNAK